MCTLSISKTIGTYKHIQMANVRQHESIHALRDVDSHARAYTDIVHTQKDQVHTLVWQYWWKFVCQG